jgi:hypothetical protein
VSVQIDASELNNLGAMLTERARVVPREARAVVEKGALNVKDEARRLSSGIAHAPLYPASIGYDVLRAGAFGLVEAEIGPDKDKPQGALGNVLEYGTVNNAPLAHLGPALDREGPRFAAAMLALGTEGLT